MAETWIGLARRLSRAIRDRRLARDLSQPALARLADVSLRRLQQLESEEADENPSLKALHKIAVALDTSVIALLEPARPKEAKRRRATKERKT